MQRVAGGAGGMSAAAALWIATRGDAAVLDRPDCGQISPGKRADIAIRDVSGVESAGKWALAALVLAGPMQVRDMCVEGQQVARDGQLTTFDLPRVIRRQNQLAAQLAS